MSTYSYESYKKQNEKQNYPKRERKVGYFFLPDNESSALVRFDYSSTSEFEFADIHRVKTENGYRNVACLRTPNEPLSKCPFCEHNEQRSSKMFVKLIEYTTTEDGKVQVNAKVWERPAYFAKTLETYLNEYGDLRDVVFKIVRKGAKGEMKVAYDIMYKNPMMYSEEAGFKKDFSGFDGFELNHHSFMERNAEEMRYFLDNGSFPPFDGNAHKREENVANEETPVLANVEARRADVYEDPSAIEDDRIVGSKPRTPNQYDESRTPNPYAGAGQSMQSQQHGYSGGGSTADPTVARPRRTYDYK